MEAHLYEYRAVPHRPAPPTEPGREPRYDDVSLRDLYVLGNDVHHVPAPLDRMIENVLDWEHLPFVHPENFAQTTLLGQGPGWYRARFANPPLSSGIVNDVLVVVHSSSKKWLLTIERGPQQGLVVHAEATEVHPDRIIVRLTFYLPTPPRNEAVRRALLDVYRRKLKLLYDQDVEMMVDREAALQRHAGEVSDVEIGGVLGTVDDVRRRTPFLVAIDGRRFWIKEGRGTSGAEPGFEAFAADCPHMFAPLPCPRTGDTAVVCPWHAYRFDAGTGRSTDGRGLRLAARPALAVEDGRVVVHPPTP